MGRWMIRVVMDNEATYK